MTQTVDWAVDRLRRTGLELLMKWAYSSHRLVVVVESVLEHHSSYFVSLDAGCVLGFAALPWHSAKAIEDLEIQAYPHSTDGFSPPG